MYTNQQPIDSASTQVEPRPPQARLEAGLQQLIPIAMVIVGGCGTCAEKMVTRALGEGSSWQDVDKTLRIVANMQKLDCFAKAVGRDVVARMDKPLADWTKDFAGGDRPCGQVILLNVRIRRGLYPFRRKVRPAKCGREVPNLESDGICGFRTRMFIGGNYVQSRQSNSS